MRAALLMLFSLGCVKSPPESAIAPAETSALPGPEVELPFDPDVRRGVLDNGLRWFIEPNKEPANRAVIRLFVDAGSVLEDEKQLGLAHFVEHMAFNGSENFEGNELIQYLESVGTKFGAHLNAHTSFDETVYKLEVPTDDPEVLEQAFVVFSDWAQGLTFDPEEIEKERGVVLEEWRTRLGAMGRITDATVPSVFYDSPYAERLPIGTEDSLRNFEHEDLKRFYKDWYRPDLMGFVIVGDVDPDFVESKIEQYLGGLVAPEEPKERVRPGIPSHEELLVVVHPDPEMPRASVSLMSKHDAVERNTHGFYREGFVQRLAADMINERLRDVSQQQDAPFLYAGTGRQRLSPTEGAWMLQVSAHEEGVVSGFEAAMVEVERVVRHGFQDGELQRAKARSQQSMESYYKEQDTTSSVNHASELLRHLATGEPVPGVDYEYALSKRYLPEITVEECERFVREEWLSDSGRVVQVIMPQKEGLPVPTEEDIRAVFDRVAEAEIEAPASEEVLDAPLVPEAPTPGEVVARSEMPDLGLTEWQLSNGVRVFVKPTDFKADSIRFRAWSDGGYTLVDEGRHVPARTASSIRGRSGLGAFDNSALSKRLAGIKASVSMGVSAYGESVSGSASVADLETALQLVHLGFTSPRFDELGFSLEKTNRENSIRNRLTQPGAVMSDAFNEIEWASHPRMMPWTLDTLEQMDLAASKAVFAERFADAGDFSFLFVGNVDLEVLEPLVEMYLGSLPSLDGEESRGDDGARRVTGVHQEVVRKGLDPQARVRIRFHGPIEESWEARNELYTMTSILGVLLREELREELGGVYGVGVSGNTSNHPESTYTVTVSWGCDPERVEELKSAAFAVIERMRTDPVLAKYVSDEQAKRRRERQKQLEDNGFWLSSISSALRNGWDPMEILNYDARVDAQSTETVLAAAKTYLNPDQYIEVVMLPETSAAE